MRFFVLVGSDVRGPLTVDDIRSLRGLSPEMAVCPEERDHKNENSWMAAACYPELFPRTEPKIGERDGGASRFWQSAVAREHAAQALAAANKKSGPEGRGRGWLWLLAVVLSSLAFVLLNRGRPESRPAAEKQSRVGTVLDQALPLLLPPKLPRDEAQALRRSAGLIIDRGQAEIVIPPDGRGLKTAAVFSYDAKRGELRPINDAARGLLDIRLGAPHS